MEEVKDYFEKLAVEAAFTHRNQPLGKLGLTFMRTLCLPMALMLKVCSFYHNLMQPLHIMRQVQSSLLNFFIEGATSGDIIFISGSLR